MPRSFWMILLFTGWLFSAAAVELSPAASISLLTCSPGQENFNAYGHSALRVNDPLKNIDLVYNYGTFDNHIENFGWKFARGTVQYSLEIESFRRFYANYDYYNRSIYEQILDLSAEQKQHMFDFLNENAREENKYYWYDFIFNNCSSIIRDIVADETGATFSNEKSEFTFRKLIDHYNRESEWNDLGIDLLLGSKIDRRARKDETMFLPDFLMREFDNASMDGHPLVSEKKILVDHGYRKFYEGKWQNIINPLRAFWLLFMIYFIYKIYSRNLRKPVFAVIFLNIIGLAGWFMFFMWVGTRHDATKWNLNILWAFPLFFPMAFYLLKADKPKWVVKFFFFCRILLITLLFLWPLVPQQFNIAVLPLMLTAIMCISSNIPMSPDTAVKAT